MTVSIKDIDEYLSSLFPKTLSESWDNDGIMLCKDTSAKVTKALVCLEVSADAIERAAKLGAQLIVTHHPFIFRPLKNVTGESYAETEALMKNGISVLSYHTRYDKAQGGVNDVLCETLGLENVRSFGEFLRVGELTQALSAEAFAQKIIEKLGSVGMRVTYERDARIRTVAVCGGAGKEFLPDAKGAGADAFVSADFSHNTFLDAKEYGIALFDAGHYSTENPAATRLCRLLSEKFADVSFAFYDVGCPFFAADGDGGRKGQERV